MPRRRRPRRLRRPRLKKAVQQKTLIQSGDEQEEDDYTTPPENNLDSSLKSTPVNYRRSLNRYRKSQNSFNVTNLNVVFDAGLMKSPHVQLLVNDMMDVLGKSKVDEECPLSTPKLAGKRDQNLSKKKLNNEVSNTSNKMNNFQSNEFNLNPYLQQKENKGKDNTVGELSFFSPQLYNFNPTSTPIEAKLGPGNNNTNLVDFLRKNDEIIPMECNNKTLTQTPSTPSSSMHKTPPSVAIERVLLQSAKSNCRYRTNLRSKTPEVTRTFSFYERLFFRLRRYVRVSAARWSSRLLAIWSQIGITLRNGFSAICNWYPRQRTILPEPCSCPDYKQQIVELNTKIVELSDELTVVKTKLTEHEFEKQHLNDLILDLGVVKQEIRQISELRSDFESLKAKFHAKTPPCYTQAPPPAPPPPPPPPPPSLPMTIPTIKITRSKKLEGETPFSSRPVITLDDILKVKLKKASSNRLGTPSRRASAGQPMVSMDMLRQVKLKPASRPALHTMTPDTMSEVSSASLPPTSPHSSLVRLLSDQNGAWRVKRLRKSTGYSLDSICRKSPQKMRRDRDRDGS